MNKLAAKVTTWLHMAKDEERGDIVQTLIIIGISVVLGAVVVGFLTGLINGYIGDIEGNVDASKG